MKCICGHELPARRRRGQRTGIDWSVVAFDRSDADKARELGCDRATVTYHRRKFGAPAFAPGRSASECAAMAETAELMLKSGRVKEAILCVRAALRDLKGIP